MFARLFAIGALNAVLIGALNAQDLEHPFKGIFLDSAAERETMFQVFRAVLQPQEKARMSPERVCRFDILDTDCPPSSAYPKSLSAPPPPMPLHVKAIFSDLERMFGSQSDSATYVRWQRPLAVGDTIHVEVRVWDKLNEPGEFDETTLSIKLVRKPEPRIVFKEVTSISSVKSGPRKPAANIGSTVKSAKAPASSIRSPLR